MCFLTTPVGIVVWGRYIAMDQPPLAFTTPFTGFPTCVRQCFDIHVQTFGHHSSLGSPVHLWYQPGLQDLAQLAGHFRNVSREHMELLTRGGAARLGTLPGCWDPPCSFVDIDHRLHRVHGLAVFTRNGDILEQEHAWITSRYSIRPTGSTSQLSIQDLTAT